MARIRVTVDDLLNAVIAAKPLPPGAEWQTTREIHAAAKARKEQIALSAVQKRLAGLVKAGKAETMMAPRRGLGTGRARYYRLKKS